MIASLLETTQPPTVVPSPAGQTDFRKEFARLQQMLHAKAKRDPDGLARETLDFGVGMIANLLLRLHYFVDFRLKIHSEKFINQGGANLPDDLLETVVPQ